MFIIQQTWNPKYPAIWCTDGDWHGIAYVGFGAKTARTWKTEAGARRYAEDRWNNPANRNRITGVNAYMVEIVEVG